MATLLGREVLVGSSNRRLPSVGTVSHRPIPWAAFGRDGVSPCIPQAVVEHMHQYMQKVFHGREGVALSSMSRYSDFPNWSMNP